MEKKKYSSYDEINRELEILKIQKELDYQRLVYAVEKTRDNLTPRILTSGFMGSVGSFFTRSGTIQNLILSFIFNRLFK
ncbi:MULTISPECIES: DUF6327 family protein [Flavobacterium]|uniref:DUF6327 family protein n=1 Tax=Flavobacterium TaxID=237 RepID=UPI00086B8539|nr:MULTISPECIES: DUF6327 family protein [Flavobacterium]MBN9285386.1 hypothetical protein [Flavobacterium sp.]ODS85478.1 MAG: hypothetical protein ABS44_15140 [Chryseobacterium sp. SCN 40-13]OJV71666.1 MAG: hypothetical protein BGO42_12480 [Flavobacterium sp. 40-81]